VLSRLGLPAIVLVLTACAPHGSPSDGPIRVVAAENVWGSVVAQIGGERVRVRSIVSDPNADPHEFESDVVTARAVADARYVVINGAGYDAWAEKLLDANPVAHRDVLSAGDVVGKRPGDNPHLWYEPGYVQRVADRIAADLSRIDPAGRAYFRSRRDRFARDCAPYRARIAAIRMRFAKKPLGATEDVVAYLTAAAGLDLTTPTAFMQAVANGTEPPTGALLQLHRQLDSHAIRVLLYNVQTSTSVTSDIRARARASRIPVVTVTETIVPPDGRFEDWQLDQTRRLEAALKS